MHKGKRGEYSSHGENVTLDPEILDVSEST